MHRILTLGLFGVMILAPLSAGSPIDGSFSKRVELREETFSIARKFRAGERASVLAFVARESAGNMQLSVFNAADELVGEDKTDGSLVGGVLGVIWYPAEDGEYRIVVRHPAAREVYVAIK